MTFIVLALVGETIVRAIDPDPTVVMVAGVFFLIMPLSIGFMGVMHVATYCFNALGQPLPPMVLSMLRSLGVLRAAGNSRELPLGIRGDFPGHSFLQRRARRRRLVLEPDGGASGDRETERAPRRNAVARHDAA